MRGLATILKLAAPVFLVVAALHLILGVGADASLGARLSPEALTEPSLDSQNRFYGVSFALYGVVLWIGAGDVARYAPILRALLVVFFLAGLARFAAWAAHGAPALPVIGLLATELLLPPLLLVWLRRIPAPDATA